MSLSEKDRAIIEATLPGNASLTHFTDFRSSHEDLARLLAAVRQEAYKEGWNDREGDLIAGVNRIAPEASGEPVAWPISVDGPNKITDQRAWLARKLMDSKLTDGEAFGIVAYHPDIRSASTSPPNPQEGAGEPVAGKAGGFAPGSYECRCLTCGNAFEGDKRAISCRPCAEKALPAERLYEAFRREMKPSWPAWRDQSHAVALAFHRIVSASPPPANDRTKALEEAVNKAIRILSDHKLGEPRRVLDARDVLIIARAALNQGAGHA